MLVEGLQDFRLVRKTPSKSAPSQPHKHLVDFIVNLGVRNV
jgi:hypothetical protein